VTTLLAVLLAVFFAFPEGARFGLRSIFVPALVLLDFFLCFVERFVRFATTVLLFTTNSWCLEVFDCQSAKLLRIARPCLGGVDDPPGDDHRYGISSIDDSQGVQRIFVCSREPFDVLRTERHCLQH